LPARDATSPDAGHQLIPGAGRIVGVSGKIMLQHPVFNYGGHTSRTSAIGAMKVEIRELMWINRECHG
jgi:hypothetical protein